MSAPVPAAPAVAPASADLGVVIPPPSGWVARVAELAGSRRLPRLLPEQDDPRRVDAARYAEQGRAAAASALQIDGGWTLHPWSEMRDVAALLEWARQLEAPMRVERLSEHTLVIHAFLVGNPTRLVGSSNWLAADDPRVPVTFERLEQIEDVELRRRAGELDATLPPAAAPLFDDATPPAWVFDPTVPAPPPPLPPPQPWAAAQLHGPPREPWAGLDAR